MSKGQPEYPSVYAEEGTAAHDLAEQCLATKDLDPHDFLGDVINGFEVDEEMADAVREYVHYVRASHLASGGVLMVETQFDLAELDPPGPMFGTSDACIWNYAAGTLEVIDYKHGAGVPVGVIDNPQLKYYALGAALELRKRGVMSKPPSKIVLTIVQPRAPHTLGSIRSFDMTWGDLLAFKSQLLSFADRTTKPDAPLHAGDHCRWCRASAVCPAQEAHAIELAQGDFEVIPPEAEHLTDAQLARVLELAPRFEAWIRAIREYVTGRTMSGDTVEGWKLVDKRATRKWADEEAAMSWLESVSGCDERDLFTWKMKSPAQAEKTLLKGLKGDDEKRLKIPEELVDKKPTGYNLVPLDDPRPAAKLAAEDEFDALPSAPSEGGESKDGETS
jgi:hypothetical protein